MIGPQSDSGLGPPKSTAITLPKSSHFTATRNESFFMTRYKKAWVDSGSCSQVSDKGPGSASIDRGLPSLQPPGPFQNRHTRPLFDPE
jgi:hypothetical protein